MKIAIDAREFFGFAGKARYIREIIRELFNINLKNDQIVIFAKEKPPLKFNQAIKFCLLPRTVYPFSTNFWLRRKLRKENFDVLFCPTGFLPAVFSPIKTVITVHDLSVYRQDCGASLKVKLMEKLLLPMAIKKADKIIADSQSTKNDICARFGKKYTDKIMVTYLAADRKFTLLPQGQVQPILGKYDLQQKKYLLSVGTIEPRKNYLNLMKAFSGLSDKIQQEYPLIIVGKNGWNYQPIIEKAKKNKNVRILSRVEDDDLAAIYNGAKIFCYPSLYEGFGLPVLEAMKCGAPIITSKISSLPEVAANAAIYIDPNQPQTIAEAIEKLLSDQKLCDNLVELEKKQAQKFSWKKTAEETINILKN